jgi:hypothetical protein
MMVEMPKEIEAARFSHPLIGSKDGPWAEPELLHQR